MMCEGAITSILPTETIKHFGPTRGKQIYSYLFSAFGVSALLGSFLVFLLQYRIGFTGMLIICLGLTLLAAVLTFIYKAEKPFVYRQYYSNGELKAMDKKID